MGASSSPCAIARVIASSQAGSVSGAQAAAPIGWFGLTTSVVQPAQRTNNGTRRENDSDRIAGEDTPPPTP
jgi:hypothetical protein